MKKKFFMCMGWVTAFAFMISAALYDKYYHREEQNIAFVDINRILNESTIKKQSNSRVVFLKQKLFALADEAEKQYRLLSEGESKKSSSYDAALIKRIWDKELAHIKETNIAVINKQIQNEFSHRYSIVLTGSMVTFADKKVDITDDVILSLESKRIDYGDLPDLSVKALSDEDIKRRNRDGK
ncbi:hypothetical protein [Enterobacter hormaechei]|uniref:hypothetical protein n=1 Tax=Enterobacter hormaechei TaxID=158836 RepID=UPI0029703706|nr:hypothetical protein [Enterobacter cloacae]